jgi:hypothetical protein
MKQASLILLVILMLAASAAAQNKASGMCGKAEKDYKIDVGDRPSHAFEISQGKCTWKGDIAGIEEKEEMWTGSCEINGDTAPCHFSSVLTMANGDKVYFRGESTLTLKGGAPQTEEVKWSCRGGTGKFKGITGKGTAKFNYAADGTSTGETMGDFTLPAPKK